MSNEIEQHPFDVKLIEGPTEEMEQEIRDFSDKVAQWGLHILIVVDGTEQSCVVGPYREDHLKQAAFLAAKTLFSFALSEDQVD